MTQTCIDQEPALFPYLDILQEHNIRSLESFLSHPGIKNGNMAKMFGISGAELISLIELIHERHPNLELPPHNEGPNYYMGYRIK